MRLKFWGVRGSTPTPQAENLRYGGNTPCLEFRSDAGALLIVDCGTGLRMLGRALTREFAGRPIRADVLLSHYHWDHIQGLPFFLPLYDKSNEFHFHSFDMAKISLEQALRGQMASPYFPVEMQALKAARTFSAVTESPLKLQDFTVHARLINHPQGCLCFRIENNGKVAVYATDNEPGDTSGDRTIRDIARGAHLLIYDSQFTKEQLGDEKKGWGHSSWEEGATICREMGVKRLILFHHDPDSDDRTIARIERLARKRFPNARAAFEGMKVRL